MPALPLHDLHAHSGLSSCSSDPGMTARAMLDHAVAHSYSVQCVTDHFWDELVPGASDWYKPQGLAHVQRNLPLPQDDRVKMVFGCETEFVGGKTLGIHPSHYEDFGFIAIPPNHFHMKGFVRPASCNTEEKAADLLVERLEELSLLDLPWHKVGIAHLTTGLVFTEGDPKLVFRLVDERRFRAVMRAFARLGAGIELNMGTFAPGWQDGPDDTLRLYRLAKDEGCRFYLASDAHHPAQLDMVPERAGAVVEALGLTEGDWLRL